MIDLGRVGGQFKVGEDRAEKQPGAEFARNKIGVLALPAKPAAAASGFSMTGAVSTKTLTCAGGAGLAEASQPASSFSRPLMTS